VSHHFDTTTAKDDSRLNVLDMYLFEGSADSTVMVLTTNPDAGIFAPKTLHPEGLYAFRFDLNGDARDELAFKVVFDEPEHVEGNGQDHDHRQNYRVIRAETDEIAGDGGATIARGTVGEEAEGDGGVRAFVGVAPEMWAADAFGFFTLLNTLYTEARFAPDEAFQHHNNLFKTRNVMATVLEVPNSMIGSGTVNVWATASLHGHAPETQIYRWGLPLMTHLFLSHPSSTGLADNYHRTTPSDDAELFAPAVAKFVATMAGNAGQTANPEEYAAQVTSRLTPSMLPYEIGTEASFTREKFNGRPLGTDAFDVMFTLAANTPIADGVAPDTGRLQESFPYYGAPYDKAEQEGFRPIRELIGLTY
jgi:Domain of unknown function (DUF4331)